MDTFEDYVAMEDAPLPPGHNGGPPLDDPSPDARNPVMVEIDDLYDEARNFADGEPIATPEMADAITTLLESIHDAGKRADRIRADQKKPHMDAANAVQAAWNPYIQDKRGKVDKAKGALQELLAPWRKKLADEQAEKARKAEAEAAKLREEANAAMRNSSGNLEARERAEELLDLAKDGERYARKQVKAATTGTGLRTVWVPRLVDDSAALDWAYGKYPARFSDLVIELASTDVRNGVRAIPGFEIIEEKKATV